MTKNKDIMKTFVIHIYRHNTKDPQLIVGTVEKIGVHGKMAFSSRDELWKIMNAGKNRTHKTDEPEKGGIRKKHGKLR
jgi:hypothetical protein